jgi:hypothetical protein
MVTSNTECGAVASPGIISVPEARGIQLLSSIGGNIGDSTITVTVTVPTTPTSASLFGIVFHYLSWDNYLVWQLPFSWSTGGGTVGSYPDRCTQTDG